MKSNIKVLIAVIVTAIICISTTAYAAYSSLANDIKYTPSDTTWNVDNVNDALNDLYTKAKTGTESSKVTAAYGSWKKATGWIDDGMEYSIKNPDDFFIYDLSARTVTSKFNGKLSVKLIILNTSGQSSTPSLSLYKNGESIITFDGVRTSAAVSVSEEYVIDVAENDVLVSYMYGGGSYAYFITQFEVIKN